jgi:hypothetical protein
MPRLFYPSNTIGLFTAPGLELENARRVLGYRPTAILEQLGFEMGDEREAF